MRKIATLILAFVSVTLLYAQKDLSIVFIGNSVTYGAQHPEATRMQTCPPAQAAAWLMSQPEIGEVHWANNGVNGCTSYDFLPQQGKGLFAEALHNADSLEMAFPSAEMVFCISLGCNDTARRPAYGPSTPGKYEENITLIVETLLARYPDAVVILNNSIAYMPGTHTQHGSRMMFDLLTVFNDIEKDIVVKLSKTYGSHIRLGDTDGYDHFKSEAIYTTQMYPEKGWQGSTFYLHPTPDGSHHLGVLWGKAILRNL